MHYRDFPLFHLERVPIMMVEVAGVEPASETASTERLRVYPAFDLEKGTPTGELILFHPFGSAPLSERAEPP